MPDATTELDKVMQAVLRDINLLIVRANDLEARINDAESTLARRIGNLEERVGRVGTSTIIRGSVADAGHLPSGAGIGDAYIAQASGHLHVWDGKKWNDVGMIRGPEGKPHQVGDGISIAGDVASLRLSTNTNNVARIVDGALFAPRPRNGLTDPRPNAQVFDVRPSEDEGNAVQLGSDQGVFVKDLEPTLARLLLAGIGAPAKSIQQNNYTVTAADVGRQIRTNPTATPTHPTWNLPTPSELRVPAGSRFRITVFGTATSGFALRITGSSARLYNGETSAPLYSNYTISMLPGSWADFTAAAGEWDVTSSARVSISGS